MKRRARFTVLLLVSAVVVAAPTALIVARADRGSASFSDAEEFGRNRIAAATVDLAIGARTQPVRVRNLAPGDVATGMVELANEGTVPLRYAITVDAPDNEAAPWLTWSFTMASLADGCPVAPAAAVIGGTSMAAAGTIALVGDPATGADAGDRTLAVGDGELLCIGVGLDVAAPNGAQATTTELRIVVDAEQATEQATEQAIISGGEA